MYRLLTTQSPEQLLGQLGDDVCAALPVPLQPRFLRLSAHYLEDNAHLFERTGHHLVRVTAQYTCFHDDAGVARYLPGLRVRARGLDLELIPAPDIAAACFPAGAAAEVLAEVRDKITGNHWLWFASSNMGWDLSRSRFGLFGDFSDEERAHMVRAPTPVEIVQTHYAGDRRTQFLRLREESVANKEQVGVAVIARDHDRLAELFGDALRLCLARVEEEELAAILWTAHGDEAALVEWVGSASFRRDAVAPQVVYAFFCWLQRQGFQRLIAARYEWFLPPIWSEVMARDSVDKERARHHEQTWSRLQARGLRELTP
ncbi:MAG: hypothetical protein ABIJ09_05600 [Pseudomonadota bacterium]